jgi:DNA-binding CsgD family transcriptional regulator
MSLLAEVCAHLGERTSAARLYALLRPYAQRNIVLSAAVCLGAAGRYLGLLASTLGDRAAAIQHYEAALAQDARLGARPWLAHTQHDYAALLISQGEPADQQQARTLLNAALASAQELGMPRLVARVQELLQRLDHAEREQPAPSARRPSYPDGLTAREVEILQLLAAGQTNRAMAATLVVSVPTIERHLANIYAKLGVSGRAEAAAYAVRHALVPVDPADARPT